jgi:hypothetical protein
MTANLRKLVYVLVFMAVSAGLASAQWATRGPIIRAGHTAVLDTTHNRMIVFGGNTSSADTPAAAHFNDVWFLNTANSTGSNLNWLAAKPTGTAPSARTLHATIYNPNTNRMVVFGGAGGFAAPCFNDLNVLSNASGFGGTPAWSTLSPIGTPPSARLGHKAVFDIADNIMIVFGGDDCFGTDFNDVWVLTNADGSSGNPTWAKLSPSGTPPTARSGFGAVYDPNTNRMMIFGGLTSGFSLFNDVWVLTNANGLGGTPAWTKLSPSGTPPCAREYPSATYDIVNNLMTIYGGFCTALQNDAWVLSNANGTGGTPAWTQLTASGSLPAGRLVHSAVYDAISNRMIIFGGEITTIGNDTESVAVLSHANGK